MSKESIHNNIVSAVYSIARLLSVPLTKTTISESLIRLGDNESLLAVSDILTKWRIDNAAYELSFAELRPEFCPFITMLMDETQNKQFVVVKSLDQLIVSVINNGKIINYPIGVFTKQYQNVILLAAPKDGAGDPNIKVNRFLELLNILRQPLIIICLIMISGTMFLKNGNFCQSCLLLLLIKIGGIITTSILLIRTIAPNGSYINKICPVGKYIDCNSILDSKSAKIFDWLSWSELGFFYFTGSFFYLLFLKNDALPFLTTINLCAIPYIFYSLYQQAIVIKKWCTLCCLTLVLLILEFFSVGRGTIWTLSFNFSVLYYILLSFILPIAMWINLKKVLTSALRVREMESSLAQFKYNKELFQKALEEQDEYRSPEDQSTIVLGNSDSENILTMVSNLFCKPCASSHMVIENLLALSPNLKVKIIFTQSEYNSEICKHMLMLSQLSDQNMVRAALSDWFDQKVKDYVEWSKRHPLPNADTKVYLNLLKKQKEWVSINHISYTPFLIYNDHKFPEIYDLSDLAYFLE